MKQNIYRVTSINVVVLWVRLITQSNFRPIWTLFIYLSHFLFKLNLFGKRYVIYYNTSL